MYNTTKTKLAKLLAPAVIMSLTVLALTPVFADGSHSGGMMRGDGMMGDDGMGGSRDGNSGSGSQSQSNYDSRNYDDRGYDDQSSGYHDSGSGGYSGGSAYQDGHSKGDDGDYSAGRTAFGAILSGHNEVPPVFTSTIGASGVSFRDNTLLSTTYVYNGMNITMAHLHCGNPGENGPIVVTLYNNPSSASVNGHLVSLAIDDEDIAAMAQTCDSYIGYDISSIQDLEEAIQNGDIYANVHSLQFPNGVARGQLVPLGN